MAKRIEYISASIFSWIRFGGVAEDYYSRMG